ncbi:hypothetical protein E1B28_010238 [Marasmius oreades]|uniref:Microbial-type PARG catalytic domain-containing protein n=1 Tax=Marasmius oreades TaxID=181124 RepID=A0A9P7UQY0_9AGAR|nr:uncharacterized protein E1B28_010238 [Marasmius oreades]KAG7091187.1 hypothetical protein E1B28_010238 [Marasmius oreades]
MSVSKFFKPKNESRTPRMKIANQTLDALEAGSYKVNDTTYPLDIERLKRATRYYAPDSLLSNWRNPGSTSSVCDVSRITQISLLEITTLQGARYLAAKLPPQSKGAIGVLNFASAKKPGGGFLTGAQAQEESIARSSSLYPSLMTDTAQMFYSYHKRRSYNFYYSHAMIYSPGVVLFRDDDGTWLEPLEVDVLTSPAVNAGEIRKKREDLESEAENEEKIEKEMKERMTRILFLFETREARNLVLGSYGTGVFQNNVDMVARLWTELLLVPGARFRNSFDRVVFAIVGAGTLRKFNEVFDAYRDSGGDPVQS